MFRLHQGRGELLTKLEPLGKSVYLVLCNPKIHVSTANAYAGVRPLANRVSLLETYKSKGIESIQNDFESSVFQSFPEIQDLKNALLSAGAFYAAMSGSGSSVFALFEMDVVINLPEEVDQYVIYKGSWRF